MPPDLDSGWDNVSDGRCDSLRHDYPWVVDGSMITPLTLCGKSVSEGLPGYHVHSIRSTYEMSLGRPELPLVSTFARWPEGADT